MVPACSVRLGLVSKSPCTRDMEWGTSVGSISTPSIVRQPFCQEATRAFSLLWSLLPWFQKKTADRFTGPTDRHDKSPIPTASAVYLASSRRMKNRLGQIPHSWTIDGNCRLISNCAAATDPLILARPSKKPQLRGRRAQLRSGYVAHPGRPASYRHAVPSAADPHRPTTQPL